MSNLPYNIEHINSREDAHVFYGNCVIPDPVPNNKTIIVVGGSALLLGEIGREVRVITMPYYPAERRAAFAITANESHMLTEPDIKLDFGFCEYIVKPLDIVILSKPKDFTEDDKLFRLKEEGTTTACISGRDVVYLHNTPERINVVAEGAFTCFGTLGKLSSVNTWSPRGIYAEHIGDKCTVTSSGLIRAQSVGFAVSFSSNKRVQLGPSAKPIKWDGSAATVAEGLEIFGNELNNTDGINAKIIVHGSDFYCPLIRRARLPKRQPVLEGVRL